MTQNIKEVNGVLVKPRGTLASKALTINHHKGMSLFVDNRTDLAHGATAELSQVFNVSTAGVVTAASFSGNLTGNATSATTATNLSRSILAGNGLTGGGALNADRTLTLGTPSDITATSTNSVTTTSHTHAIDGSNLDVRSANYLRVANIFDVNNASVDTLKFKVYDSYNVVGTPYAYGNILEVNGIAGHWKPQLWFDGGAGGKIRYRNKNYNATSFGDWKTVAYLDDNVASATKLQTARAINGTNFDGSANITTANWGTARTLTVGNTGKSVNGSGNISWSLTEIGAADRTQSILAGNGLTGGGTLAADRTLTLGTPSNITLSSTNSVTASSHTHNFTLGGTASQYLNGATTLATIPTITAGNGLTGGGQLTTDRTLTLGTPSTLTAATTDAVTASSHTHAITTTSVGDANTIVQTDATGGTQLNNLIVGGAWKLEQVGTELQLKYNNVVAQRFLLDGSIVGLGEITAYGASAGGEGVSLLRTGGTMTGNLTMSADIIMNSGRAIGISNLPLKLLGNALTYNASNVLTEANTATQIKMGNGWTIEQTTASLTIRKNGVVKGTFNA